MLKADRGAGTEIGAALGLCRAAFISTAVFSLVINVLMLAGPLFMLQVYDRVLASNSVSTLVALTVLLAMLYGFYGILDHIRQRIIGRVGRRVDETLRGRTFDAVMTHALRRSRGVGGQQVSDLVTMRQFISGPGPFALLDMPFTPIYLAVIFSMHWLLGMTALAAALAGFALAVLNEFLTRRPLAAANRANQEGGLFTEECRRNSEAAHAMGMVGSLRSFWLGVQQRALDENTRGGDRAGWSRRISKVERLFVESLILAVGAFPAIEQQITPGAMIAASDPAVAGVGAFGWRSGSGRASCPSGGRCRGWGPFSRTCRCRRSGWRYRRRRRGWRSRTWLPSCPVRKSRCFRGSRLASTRGGAGHHRADGGGEVDPGARSGGGLALLPGPSSPRRRHLRPARSGHHGPVRRLYAAGYAAVRRALPRTSPGSTPPRPPRRSLRRRSGAGA